MESVLPFRREGPSSSSCGLPLPNLSSGEGGAGLEGLPPLWRESGGVCAVLASGRRQSPSAHGATAPPHPQGGCPRPEAAHCQAIRPRPFGWKLPVFSSRLWLLRTLLVVASVLHTLPSADSNAMQPLRLNCGSDEALQMQGKGWHPDAYYQGGKSLAFEGKQAPEWLSKPYLSQRTFPPAKAGGCYRIPLTPGRYIVRLSFAMLPGNKASRHDQTLPWITVTVNGRFFELVRMEQHQQTVYRPEYMFRFPRWNVDASNMPDSSRVGHQNETLALCFGAIRGTAFVSAIEVFPVPLELYSSWLRPVDPPKRAVLSNRDRLAAAASVAPSISVQPDVADRTWRLFDGSLASSGDFVASSRKTDAVGRSGASSKTESEPHVVSTALPVAGAMDAPLFLPEVLLQSAFEAGPSRRLHFEWHLSSGSPSSRHNSWQLVLVLCELNDTAEPGDRVFDILVNDQLVVGGYDILTQEQRMVQVDMGRGRAAVVGAPGSKVEGWLRMDSPDGDAVNDTDSGGAAPRRANVLVITVRYPRPSFMSNLPFLELDLVSASGSTLGPTLSLVEVFEVLPVGGLLRSTSLHNSHWAAVVSSPGPFTSPDGLSHPESQSPSSTPSGSSGGWDTSSKCTDDSSANDCNAEGTSADNGDPGLSTSAPTDNKAGVIAAVVIASAGTVILVASVSTLGLLWRRHSRRRAQSLVLTRSARAVSALEVASASASATSGPGSAAGPPVPLPDIEAGPSGPASLPGPAGDPAIASPSVTDSPASTDALLGQALLPLRVEPSQDAAAGDDYWPGVNLDERQRLPNAGSRREMT